MVAVGGDLDGRRVEPDEDGILRRAPTSLRHRGRLGGAADALITPLLDRPLAAIGSEQGPALGSAIAELLGENDPVPLRRIGMPDVFGTSGEPGELMAHFGLTAADISRTAREMVG